MKQIIALVFIFVALGACIWFFFLRSEGEKSPAEQAFDILSGFQALDIKKESVDQDLALIKAKEIYRAKQIEGVDFSDGPCLSNELISDWVLDIAHNPREAIDNLSENQCSAFRDGRAHHFIELDTEGNLIRAH